MYEFFKNYDCVLMVSVSTAGQREGAWTNGDQTA